MRNQNIVSLDGLSFINELSLLKICFDVTGHVIGYVVCAIGPPCKRMPFHSDRVDADLYLDEFSAASTSFARKSIGLVEQFLHYFAKTKQEQGSGSSHHNMVERLARAKQKNFSTDFKE